MLSRTLTYGEKWSKGSIPVTANEALAASVAAGGATYADIQNSGQNVDNLWSILLGLASLIPLQPLRSPDRTFRAGQSLPNAFSCPEQRQSGIDADWLPRC